MQLLRPVARVRRRLRLQAMLDGGALAAVLGAALVLAGVYLWKLQLLSARGLLAVGLTALGVVVAAAVARAIAHIPLGRAALRIDESHGLHDRVRSALAFADERAPTPFMQAAIADAEQAARAVDASKAAPLRRPAALTPAAIVAALAGVVALLQFPPWHHALVAAPPAPPHLVVDRAALLPELQAAAALQAEAERSGDDDTRELAAKVNELLRQIDAEELTRKQAFDKLAELENKYLKADDGALDELEEKLKKAGTELSKSKLLDETGKALQKEDLDQARKELEKLAAEAEKRAAEHKLDEKWDQKQREEAAKAMEEAARNEERTKAEEERQRQEQRLREEERRLKKQLAERPNDQELQRRLERNQRELQRLEREKQQRAEQQRQLQRLQRELEKAAEQLRQKMSPEALKQLAEQMRQMEQQLDKLSNQSRAQMQIAEIKEVLRRMGRSSSGSGGQQQQNRRGLAMRDGKGQGKGKSGQGNKGEQMLREFDQRAGGKQPDTFLLGEKGDGNQRLLLPLPGQGNQPGQSGDEPQLPGDKGDGIGDQHDPNLMGEATKLDGKRHETRVEGAEGAGPSRSQTILGSAEKGFASTSYKRVYGDYTSVVEEVMSKEKVPPGYRFYVKRYFQLIKPRE